MLFQKILKILFIAVKKKEVKYECCPNKYTLLPITLYLRRKPLFYIINLIIPTSITTLIAIVGFFTHVFFLPKFPYLSSASLYQSLFQDTFLVIQKVLLKLLCLGHRQQVVCVRKKCHLVSQLCYQCPSWC